MLREMSRSRHTLAVLPDNVALVTSFCVECDREESVAVDFGGYAAWCHGVATQDAFPLMPKEWREFYFLSGLCPRCWDSIFTPTDD